MVITFTVDRRSRQSIANVQRIVNKWSDAALEASDEFGKTLRRSVKRHITAQKLIWHRDLWNSVKWRQRKNVGQLSMLSYGVELQERRPARKVARKNSKLWRWALSPAKHGGEGKGMGVDRALKRKVYARKPLNLRRYDVYLAPMKRTLARLPIIIKRHTRRVVQTNGRSV